jgi:hypothetical protein
VDPVYSENIHYLHADKGSENLIASWPMQWQRAAVLRRQDIPLGFYLRCDQVRCYVVTMIERAMT